MQTFLLNHEELKFPDDTSQKEIKEELEKDSHYTTIIFGSENFWSILKKSVPMTADEILAGVEINDVAITAFIKEKK